MLREVSILFLKSGFQSCSASPLAPYYNISEISNPSIHGEEEEGESSAEDSYVDCEKLAQIRAKSPSSRSDRENAIMSLEYSAYSRQSSRPPADRRDWF